MSTFYEKDHVDYLGDGLDGIPPAQGQIMAFVGNTHAHVSWKTGSRVGGIDIVALHDLTKSASMAVAPPPPRVSAEVLVRRVMKREGSAGVLQYLAVNRQLDSWDQIAAEVRHFVEARLAVDASMETPYELLSSEQMQDLISTAASTLLRDKFNEEAV